MKHKKIIQLTNTITIIFIIIAFISCSKLSSKINFKITSHKSGNNVSLPLPLELKGTIENYKSIQEKYKKTGLHIYIVEQSTKEKIWHIEPEGKIDSSGKWKALTWLGSRTDGRGNTFNVCVFATDEPLKLKKGNNPVKKKPDSLGESCIKLKRIK